MNFRSQICSLSVGVLPQHPAEGTDTSRPLGILDYTDQNLTIIPRKALHVSALSFHRRMHITI